VNGLELAQSFRYGSPGYFLKYERACAHLQSLAFEGGIFVHEHLHPGPAELVEEDGWTVIKWSDIIPPPAWWTLFLGDFLHNARGCLDHLVYGLVSANERDPGSHTSFPICVSEAQWLRTIEERRRGVDPPAMTEGVSEAVLEIIKRHQPFNENTVKAREGHPLMNLLRMSNTDKHRQIHISAIHSGKVQGLHFLPSGYIRVKQKRSPPAMERVEKGAVIARVRVEEIQPIPADLEVGVKYKIPAKLAFTEPGDTRIVTLDDLFEVLNAILRIGEDLEVCLDPPQAHLKDLADDLAELNAPRGSTPF
jgi:hypothetical protein